MQHHIKPEELRSLTQLSYGDGINDAILIDAIASYDPVPELLLRNNSSSMPTSCPESVEQPSSGGVTGKKTVRKTTSQATKAKAKESHKRYRERVKNKANETKEAHARIAEEIAALKLEQAQLQSENSVLENMCRYTDSALSLIRCAASSISTLATDAAYQIQGAARARLMTVYLEVVDTIWSKFIRPSDEQLRAVLREQSQLTTMRESLMERLCMAITDWQASSPAGREMIERKIAFAFETRARFTRMLMNEKPELFEMIFANSMKAQPTATSVLLQERTKKQIVYDNDLIAACVVTEEQRIALQRHWKIYLSHFNKAKALVDQSKIDITTNLEESKKDALPNEPIGSLSQVAKSHLALKESTVPLGQFSRDEMVARINLAYGGITSLRPLQQAYLMIETQPNSDMIIDIVECYKALLRMEGRTTALKNDYEIAAAGGEGIETYRKIASPSIEDAIQEN